MVVNPPPRSGGGLTHPLFIEQELNFFIKLLCLIDIFANRVDVVLVFSRKEL